MKNINRLTFITLLISLIGFGINFVYAQPSTAYVIPIHTDAFVDGGYQGGAHVIGSGNFANRLQAGLSASADKYGVFKKPGVVTTAVNQGNKTLSVAQNAGVTNAALIEVGAHSKLLDSYGSPTGVANSSYVNDLINNVIGPNVSGSGKIVIPMDHTRKRIPDTTGGNTYEGSNATGAAPYKGYVERDVTDAIAAKIKAQFGDRVIIIKPEDYNSYAEYDAAIVRAVGGTATTDPSTSSAPSTATPTTTAGTVSYQSYTNFPGVGRISDLCQLINALWLLGFAVLLTSVLGMFLWGGYMYVTAGVNAGKVNQAKEIFTNTITGLIIGLSIFIIINIINPGLLQGNCSIPSVGSGSTFGEYSGAPVAGNGSQSLLEVARRNSVGKGPDGRCYQHVANYIDQAGFCGIQKNGFNAAIPAGYYAEARQFAEYLNQGDNASRLGIVKLGTDNPYRAPAGSIVVVSANRPGCEGASCHPTAGDISVADGKGNFYNGGEMGFGGSNNYPSGNNYVLGIYACK